MNKNYLYNNKQLNFLKASIFMSFVSESIESKYL